MLSLAIAIALSGLLFVAPAAAAQKSPSPQAALPTTPSTPAEILDQVAPSIVQVLSPAAGGSETSAAVGSGVAVVGGIVTTDNLIADAGRAVVVASDGRRSTATVIRRSPMRDLVLLATDLTLPPADLEAASNQRPGDTVLVIGYPRPDAFGDAAVTVTHGLISALRRDQEGVTYLQTDAPMDPGVAGGALVNLRGHLIGVPSFSSDQSPGLNFGMGAEEVQALLQQAPTAPSSVATYDGDPHGLLPTPPDLGPAWQAAPQEPGAPTSNQGTAGALAASVRLVTGDASAAAGPFGELRAVALIAPDAEHAQWAWERALRQPPAGFVRFPDPAPGSTCHLYQRTGRDVTDVQVVCRESNVVIGVTLSGTSDVATAVIAVHAASVMIQRVQNGNNPENSTLPDLWS
jgi:S1-C subfamily serine protease